MNAVGSAGREEIAEGGRSVLLVDADPRTLFSLEPVLDQAGYRVVNATSGPEALRFLLREDFAVIVLDMGLQQSGDFELPGWIRSQTRSRGIPILFLTPLAGVPFTEDAVREAYDLGVVDHLFKPVDPALLRAKVTALAEVARERDVSLARARGLEARCQELEVRNATLVEALAESRAFNHTAAHELRGRLSGVTGYAEVLLHEHGLALGEEAGVCLDWLVDAAHGMRDLVDDLLRLSEVGRGEARHAQVSLSALAEAVVGELRRRAPERRVEVAIAPRLTATGDERLLRVLLENLLGNAWKYTRKRPVARIIAGAAERDGELVYFVRDNGAGFDPSRAAELFRPFRRLHSRSEFEGTGVGLATVEWIVRHHGGRVWAEGDVGQGATFFFTIA